MGLTHYAILNQLDNDIEFTFVDPDKKISLLASRNLNVKILKSDDGLRKVFDYVLICTPPMFHIPILQKCIYNEMPKIFVEKPFGGISDDFSHIQNTSSKIVIGYVLRYNPVVQWVKENLDIGKVVKVEGSYNSNTLERKPKGWRNSSFSGVTNEVGAHIIDLCVYLFALTKPKLIRKNVVSVVSDIDDIVASEFEDNKISYNFYFNWVNKDYRKPVFRFNIFFDDDVVWRFDQQKIEIINAGVKIKSITAVDLAVRVPFYLRGVDFTLQMQDFIGSQEKMATVQDALVTRDIIKTLIQK